MSVSIKPLEDRIVVKALDAEQTTASGLVIPDTAKEKPQEGEVLAVGPGRIDDNGNRVPARRHRRRQGDLQQVRRHRGQVRRRGVPHPLRARRPRRRRNDATAPRPSPAPGARSRGRAAASSIPSEERTTHAQDSGVRRGRPPLARARRRRARQRRQGDARPAWPQRRHRQEVGRPHDHQRRRDRSPGRSSSTTRSRTSVRSSPRRSPPRPTTSPATARRRRPCSPRRWSTRACATSPPAPTRWASSAASTRPSRPSTTPCSRPPATSTASEDMANVATISAQDRVIGDLIAEAFDKVGKDGVITVEESSTPAPSWSSPRGCSSTRATSRRTS